MKKYFVFFVISIIIFFTHTLITKHAIYGDGNGYYSYTNSLYFQKNFDFNPIYNSLSNFKGTKYIFSRVFWDTSYAKGGVIRQNAYLIGTGILWLPSMFFISAVNFVFGLGASRFNLIYELGPGLTGIIFITAGLYFLEKYLSNFVSKKIASYTIFALFFGSYIFYYSSFEPALSHQPSFFIISFLLFWVYKFKPKKINLFILGLLAGLLSIIRIVDILLLIPIFCTVFEKRPKINNLLFIGLGGLLAILPQVAYQYLAYGNIFVNNYFICQNCAWKLSFPHFVAYLFSPVRGLFVWSPIFLVGIYGLVKQKKLVFLFSILLLWIVSSSWPAYLSAGFGQRFSFSVTPYFAFGIAYVFNKLQKSEILLYTIPFALWNFILLVSFYVLRLGR